MRYLLQTMITCSWIPWELIGGLIGSHRHSGLLRGLMHHEHSIWTISTDNDDGGGVYLSSCTCTVMMLPSQIAISHNRSVAQICATVYWKEDAGMHRVVVDGNSKAVVLNLFCL
jgi:hypothetical protein